MSIMHPLQGGRNVKAAMSVHIFLTDVSYLMCHLNIHHAQFINIVTERHIVPSPASKTPLN